MQPGSEGGWPTQLPQGENLFSITREAKAKTLFCMVVVVSLLGGYTNESNMPRSFLRLFNMLNTLAGNCTSKRNEDWERGKELFHFVVTHCLLA